MGPLGVERDPITGHRRAVGAVDGARPGGGEGVRAVQGAHEPLPAVLGQHTTRRQAGLIESGELVAQVGAPAERGWMRFHSAKGFHAWGGGPDSDRSSSSTISGGARKRPGRVLVPTPRLTNRWRPSSITWPPP